MLTRAVRPALRAGAAVLARYGFAFTFASAKLLGSPMLTRSVLLNSPAVASTPNIANYATLREIESRLKSIRNIEKITKTMKIVASTKLTRAQRAMTESRTYGQTSNTVFEKAETKVLEGENKKTLLIICSSDKGLCGAIHSGMSRKTRKMIIENPEIELAIVGEKCKAQLSRSNPKNMKLSFSGIGKDVPTFAEAQAVADQLTLLLADYGSVKIMHNKFLNAQSYEPVIIEAFSEEAIQASGKFFHRRKLPKANNYSKFPCI
jgi:F-type H+-transporting ATPase subunit gamma